MMSARMASGTSTFFDVSRASRSAYVLSASGDAGEHSRTLIGRPEVLLVLLAGEGVDERASVYVGSQLLDFVALLLPGYLRHLGNSGADRVPERAHGQILACEDVLHVQAVHIVEGALDQVRRHVEPDKVVVRLRKVCAAGDMDDIECEFDHDVTLRILGVGHLVAN